MKAKILRDLIEKYKKEENKDKKKIKKMRIKIE